MHHKVFVIFMTFHIHYVPQANNKASLINYERRSWYMYKAIDNIEFDIFHGYHRHSFSRNAKRLFNVIWDILYGNIDPLKENFCILNKHLRTSMNRMKSYNNLLHIPQSFCKPLLSFIIINSGSLPTFSIPYYWIWSCKYLELNKIIKILIWL